MGDQDQNDVVAEDATNIVRAAFAAMARDPGTTSASFRVVNGVVLHRCSMASVPHGGGDGSANGVGLEKGG